MLRPRELQWFYQEGASNIFPDAWEAYLEPIPEEDRGNLIEAYYGQLTHEDITVQKRAARAWSVWEASTSKLMVDTNLQDKFGEDEFAIAFARIECHYFINGGFFERPDQILANIDRIRHIPTVIVQGRYDVVCPMRSAWDLHRVWPEAELVVIPDAGHSITEVGIADALIQATDSI